MTTANNARYIIILHTDGGIRLQALESREEPTLEQLQTLVDGYIETVPATYGVLIVNEEGKMYPLPYNANATALMRYQGRDYIVGDAVLCLAVGDTLTGFPLRQASRIVDSLREAVTA